MKAKIREVFAEDAVSVYRFLVAQKRTEKEEEIWLKKWELLYKKNPELTRDRHYPLGWVIEKGDKSIGGYLGNIILPYSFKNEKYIAASITDLAVEPKFRFESMSLLKEYVSQSGVDILINTTANKNAKIVFDGLKFVGLPSENYDRMYYIFINPFAVINYFSSQRLPKILAQFLAKIAGSIVKAALFFRDKIFLKARAAANWKTKEIFAEEIPLAYNTFWSQEVKKSEDLMFLRIEEVLKWRFDKMLLGFETKMLCLFEGENMLGYVIVEKRPDNRSGLLRVRVVDLVAVDNSEKIIDKLIFEAYAYSKKEKADLLESFFLPKAVRIRFNRMAHFIKKRGGAVHFRPINPELSKVDLSRQWYATCIDGDSSF